MANVLQVKNPATGTLIQGVRLHTEEDIRQALRNGHEGFKKWRKVHAHERSRLLQQWSDLIKEQ
ncbi:aldehyde dehydrogenase family protein [Peribacillus kribbensis]|uniref:aldehyde dehydrogenase family protein n=1 Tax=Peribacillus kribbensis TaxID=356658 RepID=UPI0004220075|nr:aldehyde dehydrogenase family protein [Peribacillus kribbensis]